MQTFLGLRHAFLPILFVGEGLLVTVTKPYVWGLGRERAVLSYFFPAITPFRGSRSVYFRDVPTIAKSLAQVTSMVV